MKPHGFPLRFSALLGFVGVVVVIAVAAGVFPFRQIIQQGRAVELAERQVAAIQAENRRLEDRIAALRTDEEVERLAREQFGLVRPGEIGYVAVAPPGSEPAELAPLPFFDDTELPWWKDIWTFLTGADVEPDG